MTSSAISSRRGARDGQGAQQPRIRRVPDYVSSAGAEAIELCALAGLDLDPWQQLVLTDMLGERDDGKWASFEFGVVAPRQNGKDAIFEGRELTGLFLLNEQLIIHSAHEQATASEHFRRLLNLIESVPEFDQRVLKAPKGKGAEAIELRGGQRIFFKTRTAGGGRGFTGDLVVLNEAMIVPTAFTSALVPTMAARSITGNPQLVYGASAVDQQQHEHGIVLARLRSRALAGASKVGYCEWSIDVRAWMEAHGLTFDEKKSEIDQAPDDLLADREAWAISNPGKGIRISEEHIANEYGGPSGGALDRRGFLVERLGQGDWPDPNEEDGGVISLDQWNELALEENAKPPRDPLCFSFDISPNQSSGAIVACGLGSTDKIEQIETIEHQAGTGWIVPKLADLAAKNKGAVFVCDSAPSAAASLIPELELLGIEVTTTNSTEFATACQMIFDAVDQLGLRHLGTPELAAAIKGAVKRPIGDAGWAWSRKTSSVDITAIVAATLAVWGRKTLLTKKKKAVPPVMFA